MKTSYKYHPITGRPAPDGQRWLSEYKDGRFIVFGNFPIVQIERLLKSRTEYSCVRKKKV